MLDKITNNNSEIIDQSQNLDRIKAIGTSNPFIEDKTKYFVDESSISSAAMQKYQRELDIKTFSDILMQTDEKAANDLLDEVEAAILERQSVAESFEPYRSLRERRYPYYRIYVKNFVVYYVVIDDEGEDKIMEVRRFLYNKQDVKRLL